jgi:cellulose biosynthesis protein BcsQ
MPVDHYPRLPLAPAPGEPACRLAGSPVAPFTCSRGNPDTRKNLTATLDLLQSAGHTHAMLISTWSQKGGCGKTTMAVQGIPFLDAKPLDLDELNKHDLAKWCAKAGLECERSSPEKAKDQLLQAANDEERIWWADCQPGDLPRSNLLGMAYAHIVVVPVRGGGEQDLAQLGRCAGRVREIRESGNADLRMAVLFNAARDTARDRAGELAVRSWCATNGDPFLGTTRLRDAYAESYSKGTSVIAMGGPAAEEMRGVLKQLINLLPPHLVPAAARAA